MSFTSFFSEWDQTFAWVKPGETKLRNKVILVPKNAAKFLSYLDKLLRNYNMNFSSWYAFDTMRLELHYSLVSLTLSHTHDHRLHC